MISIRPITIAAFLCLATKGASAEVEADAFRIHHINSGFCWPSGSQLKVGTLDCMHEGEGICRDDWIFGIHDGVKLWYGLDHPTEIPLVFDNLPREPDAKYIFDFAESLCISEHNDYSVLQVGDSDCHAKLKCPRTDNPARLKVPDDVYHVDMHSDETTVVKFRNDAGEGMLEISNKGNMHWDEHCHWSFHCPCQENGYEVWKTQPNENVDLRLDTTVNTDSCTYELELSFRPDPNLPFLNDPTADDFIGSDPDEYERICKAEGFDENMPVPHPILSPGHHVGLNEFYTDFAYGIELSEKAAEKVGFKLATLGASPCGIFLQPFPQYSIHFYTIDVEGRKKLKCFSDGGYFCKSHDEQCSDAGRKMNMKGPVWEEGLMCETQEEGFPQFVNLPQGYAWTNDGNPAVGINAASPGMGLHAVDPTEFAPDRDLSIPYLLQLNYDKKVIGNHVLIWSGFAKGEGMTFYEKPTPVYNCPTADRNFLPTNTIVKYDEDTGKTSVIISGPLADCSGDSFEEVKYE